MRFNSFLVQFRRFHTSSSSSRPPPTIFACVIDGYDPSYTSGLEGKLLAPTLSTLATQAIAKAAMPTFTNVNNVSILTGTTPKHMVSLVILSIMNFNELKYRWYNQSSFALIVY